MLDWDFSPPRPEPTLTDHDVPLDGTHLVDKRIALLVTGGIAAMKAPLIARALRKQGAEVMAFMSSEAGRYVTEDTLEWSTVNPVVTRLSPAAEHLSDSSPFDAYLVAPATYNTINKMRYGIADGVVTSVLSSALGRMEQGQTQVLVAPTMHGTMHNAILTGSMQTLSGMGVRVIPPRPGYGKHNIPNEPTLVAEVCRAVSDSAIKGLPILVTGGPTPVPIDNVRRITNKFTGRLSVEIAKHLYLSGADAHLILAGGVTQPPDYLPVTPAGTFDKYHQAILQELSRKKYLAGIFSAAVADYRPAEVLPGKTPSGGSLQTLNLVPTAKVIGDVMDKFPDLKLISFKYQEDVTHEQLMQIANERIARGHTAVVANRGEERGPAGEQIAYLVTSNHSPKKLLGKPGIATALTTYLTTHT